jgi:hypothetical protein
LVKAQRRLAAFEVLLDPSSGVVGRSGSGRIKCMVKHVDREAIFEELFSLKMISSASEVLDGGFLWCQLQQHVVRLHNLVPTPALLPADLPLSQREDLRYLGDFLGELADAYSVDAAEGSVNTRVDHGHYDEIHGLLQTFTPVPTTPRAKHRRRRRRTARPRPLTTLQLEAIKVVSDCKGNIAEAARRLGRDRKTIGQHYKAGIKKLGKAASHLKHLPQKLPTGCRGEEYLSGEDDRRGI